ncbi:MAG: hypothetical protein RIR68_1567 [Pseudomonadota bacterium]
MTISMYQASVPRLINGLTNLSHILGKAQAHAEAKKIDPVVFATMRLYPDMFPLSRQVQIACDVSKGLVARLAGVDIPAHEDTEKDLKDLQARIAKTIAFEQIDGTEDKDIVVKRGEKETHYKGMQFLLGHGLPNLHFHTTTTYSMLRASGVELGKADYLGKI